MMCMPLQHIDTHLLLLADEFLSVPPVVDTTTPGEPATGNVLDNATVPPGTTASVTGFSVPGSNTVYPAGSTVSLVDPVTGTVTGTMQVNPDGSYVFTPAPGYVGDVPPVDVAVSSSDGQSVVVPLAVSVNSTLGTRFLPIATYATYGLPIPTYSYLHG